MFCHTFWLLLFKKTQTKGSPRVVDRSPNQHTKSRQCVYVFDVGSARLCPPMLHLPLYANRPHSVCSMFIPTKIMAITAIPTIGHWFCSRRYTLAGVLRKVATWTCGQHRNSEFGNVNPYLSVYTYLVVLSRCQQNHKLQN